jgi:hypothetical protein
MPVALHIRRFIHPVHKILFYGRGQGAWEDLPVICLRPARLNIDFLAQVIPRLERYDLK